MNIVSTYINILYKRAGFPELRISQKFAFHKLTSDEITKSKDSATIKLLTISYFAFRMCQTVCDINTFVSAIETVKKHILKHKKMYIFGILLTIFSIIGVVYMTTELSDESDKDLSTLTNEDLVKNRLNPTVIFFRSK